MNFRGAVDLSERAAGVRVHYATEGRDMIQPNTPSGWEVEQPWLWWVTGGDGGFPPVYGNPPAGWQWGPVGHMAAIPAVTRCTSIIADTIGGLPWHLFRKTGTEDRPSREALPTPEWLADPQALRLDARVADPERAPEVRSSRVEFWTQWIISALWLGDGFVYVPVRDEAGAPRPPIWLLAADAVDVEDERYWIDDVELEAGSIIHLRRPPIAGGRGTGVLTGHAADLGLALLVRGYAAGQFQTGVPAGYIKLGAANVTKDQAEQIRYEWMATHGRGRRSIAVLSALADFHPVSVKPIDAQLSDQRQWNLRDIALAFGVPAYLLGIPGDSATYANVESRMIELARFTHVPWIERIESVLDAQVPRGQEIKVKLDGIMRADTRTRLESYRIGLDAGIYTLDEVRAWEELPPLEGGAVL